MGHDVVGHDVVGQEPNSEHKTMVLTAIGKSRIEIIIRNIPIT